MGTEVHLDENGFRVNNKSEKVHFLMSSIWMREPDGIEVANFKIHFDK